jgi:hypothetical protein
MDDVSGGSYNGLKLPMRSMSGLVEGETLAKLVCEEAVYRCNAGGECQGNQCQSTS